MSDFIYEIINGNIVEILGDDLYAPTVAVVAASWAILAFAALCDVFRVSMSIIFNLKNR